MLKVGQSLLFNQRRWHLRQVRVVGGRRLELEVVGASEAAQGMIRPMTAFQYGDDLFIKRRGQGYWQAHLQRDWVDHERGPALQCQAATWLDLLAAHTGQPAGGDLKNEFSWSYSRAAKYRQCPRAYYYHYYAAWEGWRKDAPAPVRRAYLLKNLTDLARWTDKLVHEAIKLALMRLKAGQVVAETELVKHMHGRAQADFKQSQSGRYRQQPGQLTGFQEHYYQTGPAPQAWRAAWAKVEHELRAFLNSELYAHLCRQPGSSFLSIEALQSFSLAGTKVWVQIDLVRREGNTIYVYDWKSEPVEDEELQQQLGVYGLYVRRTRPEAADPDLRLRAVIYVLGEERLLEFELNEALLQATQVMIEASSEQLRGLLFDPETNLAQMRRFPMIDDLSVCRQCQFRELCGR